MQPRKCSTRPKIGSSNREAESKHLQTLHPLQLDTVMACKCNRACSALTRHIKWISNLTALHYAEVSFQWHPEAARATNTQQTWRQEFLGSRSSTVERSSTRTAAAGTLLRFIQTIFENTSLWRLKRLVSLPTYRRYINKCIYLSIYLSMC